MKKVTPQLSRNAAWYLAFLPHGLAMGILSTLIPLYLVEELGGTLVDLGAMMAASTAVGIPASIYLGRLPDRYRRVRPFILVSFLGVSTALFLMSATGSVRLFQLLYVAMDLFAYLKGPSTSVLIAESFESSRRSSALARQGFVEGMGGAAGLALCSLLVGALGYGALLRLTGPVVLASFLIALLTIRDPPLFLQRFLDRYDRLVDNIESFSFSLTGSGTLAPDLSGEFKLRREPRMPLFLAGRALFALAASNAFTALPLYLLQRAGFSRPLVFAVFLVRSVFGATSYLALSRLVGAKGFGAVKLAAALRMALVALFPAAALLPLPTSALVASAILSAFSFSWSLYAMGAEVVTVAYARPGRLGVFDALTGLGGALGGLTGGLIPALFGFEASFLASSGLFALALLFFSLGLR